MPADLWNERWARVCTGFDTHDIALNTTTTLCTDLLCTGSGVRAKGGKGLAGHLDKKHPRKVMQKVTDKKCPSKRWLGPLLLSTRVAAV